MLDSIPNDSVVVTTRELKNKVLRILRERFSNIKVLTIEEVFDKYYFTYDNEAIYYLMRKYHYRYDVASMYLSHLREVGDNSFNSAKIEHIIKLRGELEKNGLLIRNPLFKSYLEDKTVVFYGCKMLKKSYDLLIEDISNNAKTINIESISKVYNNQELYQFDTVTDEVVFVASKICDLRGDGVSFNNIKLCNVGEDYPDVVSRIFNWYHIPYSINDNYLYATKIGQSFLRNMDSDINKTLEYLSDNFNLDNSNNRDLYNKIINILNKYSFVSDYLEVYEFIEHDFKNTLINVINYQEQVEIINSLRESNEDDYVFLLSFNQGSVPKTYKDEDYFNNTLREKLGLDTTNELNKKLYLRWLGDIRETNNLIITTKLNGSQGECYLSSLNDDLGLEVKRVDSSYNYSNLANILLLGEKLDTFIRYGEKEKDLELLYTSYPDVNYQDYDNSYKKIDKDKLRNYLNKKLVLSYSG